MRMTLLPDGPEQEARDEAFKRNSANPTPQTSPPEAVVEQKMKNFDPPAVMTNAFAPTTRAYLMSYDVLAHVCLLLLRSLWGLETDVVNRQGHI